MPLRGLSYKMLYVRAFPRPRVVVSACLNLKPVRYNGQEVRDEFVLRLLPYCEVIEVCPEVSIGLGVPRDRIIVYKKDEGFGLSQPSTGLELTDKMESFTGEFLRSLRDIDGFILKSKSPSCGVSNTKVYRNPEGKEFYSKGKGFFAMRVLENFQDLPVEDEGRLKSPELREHFLTRLFALADLRESTGRMQEVSELMEFHQRYKYLLMAHSQVKLKAMGRLVANAKMENFRETLEEYRRLFIEALKRRPSVGQHVNTIIHIFGHLSKNFNPQEKAHFMRLVENNRGGKIDRKILLEFLRSYAYRFENQYLMTQTYLQPYPEDLQN